MKWINITLLCSLILTANSCTVLGFATDMALMSVIDHGDNEDAPQEELFFTNLGIKQDAEFVAKLVTEIPSAKKNLNPQVEEKTPPTTLICKNIVDDKQQCYPPEYYQDMYIKHSTSEEVETLSSKDSL